MTILYLNAILSLEEKSIITILDMLNQRRNLIENFEIINWINNLWFFP